MLVQQLWGLIPALLFPLSPGLLQHSRKEKEPGWGVWLSRVHWMSSGIFRHIKAATLHWHLQDRGAQACWKNPCSYLSLTCNSMAHMTGRLEPGSHWISVEVGHLDPVSSSKILHQWAPTALQDWTMCPGLYYAAAWLLLLNSLLP